MRCDELCGLWHGAMFNTGQSFPTPTCRASSTGRRTTEQLLAQNTAYLPPFAYTYMPDANGADGGYYPDTVDPYSPVETYGAPQPAGRRLTWRRTRDDEEGAC